jgi:aminoglycoside phosphotransferase (APT) family kinase protein
MTEVEVLEDAFAHLNPPALGKWLDEQGAPGDGEPIGFSTLSGGLQNDLFLLTRGDFKMVLRRPPKKVREDRIAGMLREIRVARALRDTDVPQARLIAANEGTDLMGTPFFVMDLVDGWSPTKGWQAPFDVDLSARAELGYALVDGAARLATVDYKAVGLEDFGKPDGFHARQTSRWSSVFEKIKVRELPGMESAAAFLSSVTPSTYVPGIMHGDYQFPNVMISHGTPGRLAAVLDFELTTIGDPLLDLAWALIAWPPDNDEIPGHSKLSFEGMPSRDDLLERYATVSGRPVDEFDYYLVLARYKLAIMLEQSFSRMSQMENPPEVAGYLDTLVTDLMASAGRLAQSTPLARNGRK